MSYASITTDIFQSFDVCVNFSLQIAFDVKILFDVLPEKTYLLLGKVLDANVGGYTGGFKYLRGSGTADTINIGKSDFKPFLAG